MIVEENLKSKTLYKIELLFLKLMPMIIALAYFLNTLLSYFYIDLPILSYIAGMSLLPILFMYVSSYVFKFCSYHRMFLHYIVINDLINIYDWHIGITVTSRTLLIIHILIVCIFLFIILYLYVNHNKETFNRKN